MVSTRAQEALQKARSNGSSSHGEPDPSHNALSSALLHKGPGSTQSENSSAKYKNNSAQNKNVSSADDKPSSVLSQDRLSRSSSVLSDNDFGSAQSVHSSGLVQDVNSSAQDKKVNSSDNTPGMSHNGPISSCNELKSSHSALSSASLYDKLNSAFFQGHNSLSHNEPSSPHTKLSSAQNNEVGSAFLYTPNGASHDKFDSSYSGSGLVHEDKVCSVQTEVGSVPSYTHWHNIPQQSKDVSAPQQARSNSVDLDQVLADHDDLSTLPSSTVTLTRSVFTQVTKRVTRGDATGQTTRKRYYVEYIEDVEELQKLTSNVAEPTDVEYKAVKRASNKKQKVERVSAFIVHGIDSEELELNSYILTFKINKLKRKHAPFPSHLVKNKKKFAFDHNPFWHRGYKGPTPMQIYNVMIILNKHHKVKDDVDFPLDPDGTLSGASAKLERPGHAAIGITIDNIVKVIFSQSTNNLLATRLHDHLCDIFRYDVDGESYVGTVPNYHKMLICTREELVAVLHRGGLYESRTDTIISITNAIYAANCARLGLDKDMPTENQAGAKDFVPGLLSMDYLNGMQKTDLMDHLLGMTGIGVKSAACILAFNFGMPVFAVDTHVQSMARQLEWVPEYCTDEAISCMALDRVIPDMYKYSLHQAFWHHRVNCSRCKGHASDEPCPLEHLCNRDVEKRARKSSTKKPEGVTEDTEDIENTTVLTTTTDTLPKPKKEKTKPFSVNFHKLTPAKATELGYVLARESIDNDFGVSTVKQHYVSWVLKDKAPSNKVTTVEEAEAQGWILPLKAVKKEKIEE